MSLLIVVWKNAWWRFVVLCLLFVLIGIFRYQLAFPVVGNDSLVAYNDTEQLLTGYVVAEPDIRMDGIRYIVWVFVREGAQAVSGRVYLKSELYPRYRYGDVLEMNCRLKTPEPIEDFRYDMYLAKFGVFSICQSKGVKKIGEGNGTVFLRGIFGVKEIVAEKINKLWHEPYASFMAGLLYGYRGGLGRLNDLFAITGVTHIVAISGYNITIISSILIAFFVHLSVPRKRAFWFVVVGITVFVLFAGASASVVRAGVMGVLVLFARHIGRASRVGNVMLFTAVFMTFYNPFVFIWDAGFQLSFLSTLGLVYLTPLIEPYVKRVPEVLGIRESLVSTLSATLVTLPLILYQFGRLSLVAVVVNVLILWILPFIMFLGFAAVMTTFLFLPMATVISWIAWVLMKYIVVIVTFFASLPFAAINIRFPLWLVVLCYVGMVYLVHKKINSI
ncbi:MAG: ComEC family competence protein [Candidatus Magasanikbacteria bacterium]|nr:ComEC family competence protein [Candidatus Magasanikbacteria bacterium]